ncbi:hypothetical protein [Mesorhizobium escarrei]|nr:hypothetical protein [Mesorhizobium escarrei]
MAAAAATGTGMKAEVTELRSQTGQQSIFHGAIVIGAGAAGLPPPMRRKRRACRRSSWKKKAGRNLAADRQAGR